MTLTYLITHLTALIIGFFIGTGLMCLFIASRKAEDEHIKNIGIESYRGDKNELL